MSVHLPEMEVHARGKDCEDHELEIIQQGVVGVLEEQQCEDIRRREQKTAYIIKYVMVHQDNVQTARVYSPALYGACECENHESQFEYGKEENWYQQRETGRTLIAPCDTRDCASCTCCRCNSGKGNADRCSDKSEKDG